MPVIKAQDTTAPIEYFQSNGFYKVGDKIFTHKVPALQYATQSRQPVTWHFAEREFAGLKWQDRLSIDPRVLYRMRAQQLRDRYDYLILMWSGGADSTTMLNSFLHNDITLDEVLVIWPISQTRGRYTPSQDRDSTNINSEWDFSIKPQLDRLRTDYPNLKINVVDIELHSGIEEYADDTLIKTLFHNYAMIRKYRVVDDIVRARTDQFGNVAVVVGLNPVDLMLCDDYLVVLFQDTQFGVKSDYLADGTPRKFEWFYATPDMPEISREQAHVLLDYFRANPRSLWVLDKFSLIGGVGLQKVRSGDTQAWHDLRRSVLYPDYQVRFQSWKDGANLYEDYKPFKWFWSNPGAKIYTDPWRSAVRDNHAMIDQQFLRYQDGRFAGYTNFIGKFYPIGKLDPLAHLL